MSTLNALHASLFDVEQIGLKYSWSGALRFEGMLNGLVK